MFFVLFIESNVNTICYELLLICSLDTDRIARSLADPRGAFASQAQQS